ncbi:MAG: fibrobacter succinogenes major paralogous domain-containing protein, partial [Bacteroidales bacterium]|nr:fibrobacter succinogenes major paralogous domain-containing protein [Bacteroidales bacterium]
SVSLPMVTTNTVSSITTTSAICGGNVTSDGGATVSARGVCWSTSQNPTVSDSHTTNGTGIGSFTSSITVLSPDTTYYVRAYATNSVGTAYGSQVSFTTPTSSTGQNDQPCPDAATVTDIDSNTYNTVQIGNQCWMKENLRTTRYANGDSISIGTESSEITPYRYSPNNDANNVPTYGYLYNWLAVMHGTSSSSANPSGVQGICPNGWHVPSDAEWTQLTDYVGSQVQYQCDNNSDYKAKALASTTGWTSSTTICAVGNDPSSNNATGFSVLPAGNYGLYLGFGDGALFWSASETNDHNAYSRTLSYGSSLVLRFDDGKYHGFSVRCVRDATSSVSLLTVTTNTVSSITTTSATCGGNVTTDGGATVTARGVCWSTSPNPTLADNHTTDGSGTGAFTSSITGLAEGTTYYVRAYATNSQGTSYGTQRSFTTTSSSTGQDGQPCPGAATVTDIDNNTYNTVQIGNQCWMKENLRTTRYANGDSISIGTESSEITPYRYSPNNDASNVPTYGYLYNWPAVMHSASSSTANPSGVQGICPDGWHVPSDAEWTQLTDYVRSQTQYRCDNSSENIAKALASTTGWNSSTNTCAVGNNPSSNNATGFSALPACFYDGGYYNIGNGAYVWSATENRDYYAYYRNLYYNDANVYRYGNDKFYGFSVRCVRD